MGDFKKSNNIYNLSSEGEELLLQTSTLSLELKKTEKNIEELNILESYIRTNTIYEQPVPVPAFIQIADMKISSMVDELILESTKLEFLKDKVKSIHPDYQKLTKKINDKSNSKVLIRLLYLSNTELIKGIDIISQARYPKLTPLIVPIISSRTKFDLDTNSKRK